MPFGSYYCLIFSIQNTAIDVSQDSNIVLADLEVVQALLGGYDSISCHSFLIHTQTSWILLLLR